MKIRLVSPGMGKIRASVWVNDEEHVVASQETLDLRVKKSDRVTFRVGRIGMKKVIPFQSVGAQFEIGPNRSVQFGSVLILLALVFGIWSFEPLRRSQILLTVIALVLVGIYFLVNTFAGYKAVPAHIDENL